MLYYIIMYTCTGCPTIVRSDYGTENASLSGIQIAFRYHHRDSLRATKSFMYGPSKSNIVSISYACIAVKFFILYKMESMHDIKFVFRGLRHGGLSYVG